MQRIGIEMNQDAQYEIAERALTRFKRSLFTDEIAGGVNDAFFRALEEWPNAIGWNMRDADHDDARFFIELPPKEYAKFCAAVVSAAWRTELFENRTIDINIGEAVHAGIETALGFIGLKVERMEPPESQADAPAEPPRTKRFRRRSPQAQAAAEEETGRPREL